MPARLAYLLVLAGAALWGTTGLFVQNLYTYGFTPWEVVGIRLIFSAVIITLFLSVVERSLLRIRWQDLPLFVGTGIISIAFFNFFFFSVMEVSGISLAVVMLYTGPLFVAVIAKFVFKETLTAGKIAALVIMITGCMYAVGLIPLGSDSIAAAAVLFGIASGFFYALYSIFGKFLSARYHPLTITTYSMILGGLFLLPASRLWEKAEAFTEPGVWWNGIGLAVAATTVAYVAYTAGLTHVESSRASILSIIEPVVAIIIGVAVFGDSFTLWQTFGIVLVFVAIIATVYGDTLLGKMLGKASLNRES